MTAIEQTKHFTTLPFTASPARTRAVWRRYGATAVLLAIGLAIRLWTLREAGQITSDEALPGLMALHIAAGREAPVFFYGQSYFGALEPYLLAGLFRIAGFHPW